MTARIRERVLPVAAHRSAAPVEPGWGGPFQVVREVPRPGPGRWVAPRRSADGRVGAKAFFGAQASPAADSEEEVRS